MPCWARLSTSLIIFVLDAVSSSSSFTRFWIGVSCRCTYFLRAKGFTLPQKPWRVSYCKGALPLAVSALVLLEAAGADWLVVDEVLDCWATAVTVNKTATNNATTARFFIFVHPPWGRRSLKIALRRSPLCT